MNPTPRTLYSPQLRFGARGVELVLLCCQVTPLCWKTLFPFPATDLVSSGTMVVIASRPPCRLPSPVLPIPKSQDPSSPVQSKSSLFSPGDRSTSPPSPQNCSEPTRSSMLPSASWLVSTKPRSPSMGTQPCSRLESPCYLVHLLEDRV